MRQKRQVLICNDSPSESRLLKGILKQAGFVVDVIAEPSAILPTLMWKRHHICLVSFSNVPMFNILRVASLIREKSASAEVGIVLTGRERNDTLLSQALDTYADAIVSIPADLPLLVGVVTSVIRREFSRKVDFYAATSEQVYIGGAVVDSGRRTISYGNKVLAFTKSQFNIFMLLASNPTKSFTRERIIKNVKGDEVFLETRTVDNTIYQLRKKLKSTCFEITTIHGTGYALNIK